MIELYSAPTPNGHKVSCTLEALNMDYKAILVNLSKGCLLYTSDAADE